MIKKTIYYIFLTILLVLLSLYTKKIIFKEERITLLRYSPLVVLTGSMEPSLYPGDIVVIKESDSYSVGDVITYKVENYYVTHRIIDVYEINGSKSYKTKGDNNNIEDEYSVSTKQVIGKQEFHIDKLGYVIIFASSLRGKIIIGATLLTILIIMKTNKKTKKRDSI